MTGYINAPAGLVNLRRDTVRALVGSNGEPSEINPFVTDTDPRLTEDKIADSIRTATTIVDIATATAPLENQVLTALDASSANWQYPTSDTAPLNITKDTASAGASPKAARVDHKHDISTAPPITIGTANAEGVSTALSRADHAHAHGLQLGGALHSIATTSTNGFMSATDKVALDAFAAAGSGSIQDAAYAERSDSILLGTSNVVYLTLTTLSMEPGTFRYGWAFTQRVLSNNRAVIVDIYVDSVLISTTQLAAFHSSGSQVGSGFRYIQDVDAQAHALQLQVRCTGGTCYIDRADLEFWRRV